MGRKPKYTKKTLAEAVERYFDSISRDVKMTEKKDSGRRDSKGHVIYEDVPVCNRLGEQVVITEFVEPPTVGGLCQYLGIHRSTWAAWCDPKEYPQFSDTTMRARGRMRAWCESELLTRKDVKGIIFNLQNNYDYKERHEVDLSPGAAKAVATGNMSTAEKMALLQEIGAEFGGMFPGEDDEEP